jgi:AcrR family transcriptional regulator
MPAAADTPSNLPPSGQLAPAAQRLVAAARRILVRDGFNSITVEAVAAEAGQYRDSVRYYFGSKAGLIAALVDAVSTDQSCESSRMLSELPPGPQRVQALLSADRRLAADSAAFQDFFRLLPHVLQDEELRARVAALYETYREQYVRCLAGDASIDEGQLQVVASLMVAVIDGVAIQKALDPDRFDLDGVFDAWERAMQLLLKAGHLS